MFRHATIAFACFALPVLAWAQGPVQLNETTLPPTQPDAQQRAVRDAIPLTPEMIRDLARRLGENQRAQEESVAQIASPVSRAVKVTYAPGQATSIVQTVRGYPTQLAFFDATGQPFPIVWDTNSNSAGGGGSGGGGGSTGNCNTQSGGGGGPAVEAGGAEGRGPAAQPARDRDADDGENPQGLADRCLRHLDGSCPSNNEEPPWRTLRGVLRHLRTRPAVTLRVRAT